MLTCQQYAKLHGITEGRVRQLCIAGRIPGAVKFGKAWAIPSGAAKPDDKRKRE
jgi:hypothetical protein